jgi:hypothetical protein
MSGQLPALGFLGDPSGALAGQLSDHVTLKPFSGSLEDEQQGLLIDGETTADLDKDTLQQVLTSGRLIAISSPTCGHTQSLVAITGQAPPPGVPLITYKKCADKPGFHCVLVPAGKTSISRLPADGQPAEACSTQVEPQIGTHLVNALSDSTPLGLAPPGLVPPQGSMCGYSSFQSPIPWDPGYPNISGTWDDNTAQQNTQPIGNQFLTEFFVYWVNGGNAPYYIVILRQTGPMSIGSPHVNDQNSRGWFQLSYQLSPNTLQSNGNPITSGAQLVAYSPSTASNNAQLPVTMQIPMNLNANTDEGPGSVPFIATVQNTLDYSNWGIIDQSSGAATAWQGYQASGWNPIQYPPDDANTWWGVLYSDDGDCVAMTDQSFGSIDFEMVTCWQFAPPLFTAPSTSPFNPPPSLWIGFSGGWTQTLGFFHGHPGCRGTAAGVHDHIWSTDNNDYWGWTIDLGGVAAQQNID